MNPYILDLLEIIRFSAIDNTYKMAWARAIVEISSSDPKKNKISLSQIAKRMFSYYWDQIIVKDLNQGSSLARQPEFIEQVRRTIQTYYENNPDEKRKKFSKIKTKPDMDTQKLVSIIKKDVSWRFLNLHNKTIPIYSLNKKQNYIDMDNPALIAEYSDILHEAIDFRWTQILENFNSETGIATIIKSSH